MPNEIPISTALSEASPTSLQDLFSQNPETLSDAQFDQIILLVREQRERIEQTPGRIRQTRVKAPSTPIDPEDFGL